MFSVKTGDTKESATSDRMDCAKCNFTTVKKNYLISHMRSKHQDPDTKIKCEECHFTHIYPSKMKVHYNIVHLGIKRQDDKNTCKVDSCENFGKKTCQELENHSLFSCKQCQYSTTRNCQIKLHNQSVHEGIVYPCEQCPFITKSKDSIRSHVKFMHAKIFLICTEENCTYKTHSNNLLKKHVESEHEGVVRFKCDYMNCDFVTNKRSNVKRHSFVHQSGICEHCQQIFKEGPELKKHLKLYHTVKQNKIKTTREPYKCNQCNYASFRIRELNAHAKVHGGERSYKCNQCNFASYFSSSLAGHMKTHRDEKPNPASANI